MLLRTLGGLALDGSAYQRKKPLLLLTYLVLEGPRTRRQLGELFFQGAGDPRDALSTTLRRLSRLGPLLQVDGATVAAYVPCDAVALRGAVATGDVDEAERIYRGSFLEGIAVPMAEELEEWTFRMRERLATAYRDVLLRASVGACDRGDIDRARSLAECAWNLAAAPDPEAAELRSLLDVLVRCGSSLAPEVRRVVASEGIVLASGPAAADELPTGIPAHLPAPTTSFVGREAELAELRDLLQDPSCRLLTVHGPGGIGKSRVALQLARDLLDRGTVVDGAYLVSLETVPNAEQLPGAVAAAMGLSLTAPSSATEQLVAAIGTRAVVLVLDNYEHLLPDTSFVDELLRGCPRLRVIVTSRVVLRLHEEHVFPLEGLRVAGEGGRAPPEALRLFLARARQAGNRPVRDVEAAGRVCELLEGHPLAIELAASWARTLDPEEIVAELRSGAPVLVDDATNRPRRHQDLRDVFGASWQMLGDRSRQQLEALAVFEGGFTRAAAAQVAGSTIDDLRTLVGASFLRRTDGRFERHPLVSAFSRERLAGRPEVERELRARHGRYFLSEVAARDDAILGGDGTAAALAWIMREFANVRAAWSWALQARELHLLDAAAWPLVQYAEVTGQYAPTEALYSEALASLDPEHAEQRHLWGGVLGARAFVRFRLQDFATAISDGSRAFELLSDSVARTGNWGRWIAMEAAGAASVLTGDVAAAELYVSRALASARHDAGGATSPLDRKRADVTAGISSMVLGMVAMHAGSLPTAQERVQESIRLFRPHRSLYVSYALWTLGQVQLLQSAPDDARAALVEALDAARTMGFHALVAPIAVDLAKAYFEIGDLERAQETCETALRVAGGLGNAWMRLNALAVLGKLHSARGAHVRALACFQESFVTAHTIGTYAYAMEALIGAADALCKTGRIDAAAEALGFVARHPASTGGARQQAEHELAHLGSLYGRVQVADAADRGSRLDAADVPPRIFDRVAEAGA